MCECVSQQTHAASHHWLVSRCTALIVGYCYLMFHLSLWWVRVSKSVNTGSHVKLPQIRKGFVVFHPWRRNKINVCLHRFLEKECCLEQRIDTFFYNAGCVLSNFLEYHTYTHTHICMNLLTSIGFSHYHFWKIARHLGFPRNYSVLCKTYIYAHVSVLNNVYVLPVARPLPPCHRLGKLNLRGLTYCSRSLG